MEPLIEARTTYIEVTISACRTQERRLEASLAANVTARRTTVESSGEL
jgi:hypothetical protein